MKRRIDGVFMVHVLSSPENADGFIVAGSMDWEGRTQECGSQRDFPICWPAAVTLLRIVAFGGIVPLETIPQL